MNTTIIAETSILPTPDNFLAGSGVAWFATIWAGIFAIVAIPWCVRMALKGDRIPLYVFLGGFLCSVTEPMWDHLTHLWWARDLQGPAFVGFDLNIPYFIPPAYMFFYALGGYFIYRRLANGVTGAQVWKLWGAGSLTFIAFEYPMLLLGAYQYYGDQPTKFYLYPFYNAWLNSTTILTIGLLLYGTVRLVKDRPEPVRALYVILVPVTGMCMCWAGAGWPNFMALNWPMPVVAQWALAGVSLLIALLAVSAVADVANRIKAAGVAPGVVRTDIKAASESRT